MMKSSMASDMPPERSAKTYSSGSGGLVSSVTEVSVSCRGEAVRGLELRIVGDIASHRWPSGEP
jgi:hypothetical protein